MAVPGWQILAVKKLNLVRLAAICYLNLYS